MGHILSKYISITSHYFNSLLGIGFGYGFGKEKLEISSVLKERIKTLELQMDKYKKENEILKLRLDRHSHLNQF